MTEAEAPEAEYSPKPEEVAWYEKNAFILLVFILGIVAGSVLLPQTIEKTINTAVDANLLESHSDRNFSFNATHFLNTRFNNLDCQQDALKTYQYGCSLNDTKESVKLSCYGNSTDDRVVDDSGVILKYLMKNRTQIYCTELVFKYLGDLNESIG